MRSSSRYLGTCWVCRSWAVIRSSCCMRRRALRVRWVKPGTPPGRNLMEILDQARDRAHGVPQPGGIGRERDVRFYLRWYPRATAGHLPDRVGQRPALPPSGCWGEAVESAVEGIVLGHGLAIEVRKGAQGIAVLDAFAPLAIVPVLDAHEHKRAPGLRRGTPVAAGVGVLQPAHQILAHWLDPRGWVVQEGEDALQQRVEMNALASEFKIGKAELGRGEAAHA